MNSANCQETHLHHVATIQEATRLPVAFSLRLAATHVGLITWFRTGRPSARPKISNDDSPLSGLKGKVGSATFSGFHGQARLASAGLGVEDSARGTRLVAAISPSYRSSPSREGYRSDAIRIHAERARNGSQTGIQVALENGCKPDVGSLRS